MGCSSSSNASEPEKVKIGKLEDDDPSKKGDFFEKIQKLEITEDPQVKKS